MLECQGKSAGGGGKMDRRAARAMTGEFYFPRDVSWFGWGCRFLSPGRCPSGVVRRAGVERDELAFIMLYFALLPRAGAAWFIAFI